MTGYGGQTTTLRVLPFERAHGAYQLAATEAVIDAVGNGSAPATLRMYSWSRDALILGVGQRSDQIDVEACRAGGCDVLRRLSGGTGVFHDEQTVSFQLVLPSEHPNLSGDVHANYRLIAGIVIDALSLLGVESRWASLEEARQDAPPRGLDAICFSSLAPFEILSGEKKLVGLAQVRRRTVSALQGMLYLKFDASMSVNLLLPNSEPHERLSVVLSDRTTDLNRAAGRVIEPTEVVDALSRAALAVLNAEPVRSPLASSELERARELEETRYANPEWTFRR